MNEHDVATRMARARIAQSAWALLPMETRARRLRPLRHAITQRIDEIVRTVTDEVGKPPMDVLAGDVMVTLEQLRFYERRATNLLRSTKQDKPWFFYQGTRFVQSYEPYGVALVFSPWNYPLQLSIVPMATALFAGNAVLLKCSQRNPHTAQLIRELCVSAGLPDGLVQISWEVPEEATLLLDARPDFVFFTGSGRNGLLIAQRAASLMIPAIMELGGKDAALIFASCDLKRTVDGVAYGSFSNAGQVCVGTKRIYVQQSIFDTFLAALLERVKRVRVGTGIESDMGLVGFEDVRQRLLEQVEDAVRHGAQLHTEFGQTGRVTPIVLTDVPEDSRLLLEETFGPVVCVAPFRDETDAIRAANASDFQLSASVWTGDAAQGERVALQLQSGTCAINDVIRNIANPSCAFGGNRASGYGRYHGAEGLRGFSRVKTVMTSRRQHNEVHWFPFHARTYTRLRGLLIQRHSVRNIKRTIKLLAKAFMFCALLGSAAALGDSAISGSLAIDVTLPSHAHGQIAYLVFASPAGFPGDRGRALHHDFIPVAPTAPERQRIEIGILPPGHYAVSVYLDENGDRRLNSNWLGIPREPVGASNNPSSRHGPPRFDECAFEHGLTPQTISITLVH